MKKPILLPILLAAAVAAAGCQATLASQTAQETTTPQAFTPTPTLSPAERYPAAGVISQWAEEAQASSEFADPEWSASKAIGQPDSPGCGDYQFAWASAASDSIETLEVSYQTAVYPLEITIFQSFNADQVVKVEVYDPDTEGYYTVLQKNPTQVERPCPYSLTVPVAGIDFKVNAVRITVDQSQLGLGWNEIDAVELVGAVRFPEDGN